MSVTMSAKPGPKQTSILSFFKRKNEPTSSTSTAAVANGAAKAKTDQAKINNNNKRALEVEEEETSAAPTETFPIESNEPTAIDANFINDGLLDVCFDVAVEEEDRELEDDKENMDGNNNSNPSGNSNFVFFTFRNIIRSIVSDDHFANIFDETDWNVIQEFTCLPGQVQHLFIKLYARKRAWIHLRNIRYLEIDPLGEHKNDLIVLADHGFLLNSSSFTSIEESLNLLTMPDLKKFLNAYKGFNSSGGKAKVIPLFLNYIKTSRVLSNDPTKTLEHTVLERLKKNFLNKCFMLNQEKSQVFDRIFILYYHPGYLLERIGKQNDFQWIFGDYSVPSNSYPVATTNKRQIIYSSREEFLEFSKAFDLNSQILSQFNLKQFAQIADELLPRATASFAQCYDKWHQKDSQLEVFLCKYTATGMYLRAINECLTSLERLRRYRAYVDIVVNQLLAQTVYGHNYRARWCIRTALICNSHLRDNDQAIAVCQLGLEDSFVRGGNRLELFNRLLKVVKIEDDLKEQFENVCPDYFCLHFKEKDITSEYRTITNDSANKNFHSVTLANGEVSIMSVENIVINHYLNNGFTKGIHCESSLYHNLMALFFWDIIYSVEDDSFSDAFRYHKQIMPLDLNYESFYERRKAVIDAQLLHITNLNEEDMVTEMTFAWYNHQGKASFMIDWEQRPLEELIEIAICLGADKIALICHFLLHDYKSFHKGFPDLIVWNTEKKKIKLIEVKSHTDHLSPTQSIWLSYLTKFGIDVELCHVKPEKKS